MYSINGTPLTQLSINDLAQLSCAVERQCRASFGVSILDNQNYMTINTGNILSDIDPSFVVSLDRNGDDYLNTKGPGEAKSSKIKSLGTSGSAAFHALAVPVNGPMEQFMFTTHHNLEFSRIYYLTDSKNIKLSNDTIHAKAKKWSDEVKSGARNGKHDMIGLPEKGLREELHGKLPIYEYHHATGETTLASTKDIMEGQRQGVTRIQTDVEVRL
jgi:hypothetical protein